MRRRITAKKICRFEEKLREEEKAEETIDKYTGAARKMMEHLGGKRITKKRLLEYREYLISRYKVTTVNCMISAINSYLAISGMERLKLGTIRMQREMCREPGKVLSREEYERLVSAAREQMKWRLLLIIQTLCGLGIRVSELQFITAEAVQSGAADIILKGKARRIMLPEILKSKLSEYAKGENVTSGAIFLTKSGSLISRRQIWREMKSLCAAADVEPGKVFPHNLRHLFAKRYYEKEGDVVRLAAVMGHSSIETTRHYLLESAEEHAETINSLGLVL